jgi:hypothetical protein
MRPLIVAASLAFLHLTAIAADTAPSSGPTTTKPVGGRSLVLPGKISQLTITPGQVKSSDLITATIQGTGVCKFTLDSGSEAVINQEATLPATVTFRIIIASYESRVFHVVASGRDGCQGIAKADVGVGPVLTINNTQAKDSNGHAVLPMAQSQRTPVDQKP